MTRLLIVDDDASLLKLLGEYLARMGHDVETASDGATALTAMRDNPVDLVILDVKMPGLDGWQILERMRAFTRVPAIMVTALGDESDVLKGFSLGADDYVAKPFSFAQLAARVEAVLKRTSPGGAQDILKSGELVVDLSSHRVRLGGRPVTLAPTEFDLLVALMECPGKVFTPRELVVRVWGPDFASDTDYIRRYIWLLRQKIEPAPTSPRYIHNERGVGYYFSPLPQEESTG